jgi:peptidoglycan biosynthesis protein MviN/MurJ (putative lipid II flippase)
MADLSLSQASVVILYGAHLWIGVRRRRAYWSASGWWRFAAFVILGLAAAALSLRMARGVDEGVYEGMTRWQHDAYFYSMFALMLGGVAISGGAISWLAYGVPQREFGRPRHRRSGQPSDRSAV